MTLPWNSIGEEPPLLATRFEKPGDTISGVPYAGDYDCLTLAIFGLACLTTRNLRFLKKSLMLLSVILLFYWWHSLMACLTSSRGVSLRN